MLGGFDPRLEELFLRRRRRGALAWGTIVLALLGVTTWLVQPPEHEPAVEVELQPEIQDFAVEEEPEPEIEEEPPPPPPPNTKVEVVAKPKPKPKPKPPEKKVTDAATESSTEKTVEVGAGAGTPGGMGTKPQAGPPKAVQSKPQPKPEPKAEPKPKPKKQLDIDPTVPIDRPENATAPKPSSGNASPVYPKQLRDEGVTGKVVIKLHVHRDGTVRGAKILKKTNNAATAEAQDEANKAFVAAVIKAVKTWSFEPARIGKTPITVWHTVTIPFTLTTG